MAGAVVHLVETDDVARKAAKSGGAVWTEKSFVARAVDLREALSADWNAGEASGAKQVPSNHGQHAHRRRRTRRSWGERSTPWKRGSPPSPSDRSDAAHHLYVGARPRMGKITDFHKLVPETPPKSKLPRPLRRGRLTRAPRTATRLHRARPIAAPAAGDTGQGVDRFSVHYYERDKGLICRNRSPGNA